MLGRTEVFEVAAATLLPSRSLTLRTGPASTLIAAATAGRAARRTTGTTAREAASAAPATGAAARRAGRGAAGTGRATAGRTGGRERTGARRRRDRTPAGRRRDRTARGAARLGRRRRRSGRIAGSRGSLLATFTRSGSRLACGRGSWRERGRLGQPARRAHHAVRRRRRRLGLGRLGDGRRGLLDRRDLLGLGRGRRRLGLGLLDDGLLAQALRIGQAADAIGRRVVDARRVALHADLELVREVEHHGVLDAELPRQLVDPNLLGRHLLSFAAVLHRFQQFRT